MRCGTHPTDDGPGRASYLMERSSEVLAGAPTKAVPVVARVSLEKSRVGGAPCVNVVLGTDRVDLEVAQDPWKSGDAIEDAARTVEVLRSVVEPSGGPSVEEEASD